MTLQESIYKRLLEFAFEDSKDLNNVKYYSKKIADEFDAVIRTDEFADFFHRIEENKFQPNEED